VGSGPAWPTTRLAKTIVCLADRVLCEVDSGVPAPYSGTGHPADGRADAAVALAPGWVDSAADCLGLSSACPSIITSDC